MLREPVPVASMNGSRQRFVNACPRSCVLKASDCCNIRSAGLIQIVQHDVSVQSRLLAALADVTSQCCGICGHAGLRPGVLPVLSSFCFNAEQFDELS